MTKTLTTERLKQIASSPSFSSNPLSHEVKYMARELLANREAQPVGYAENGKGFIYQPEHRDRIKNPVAVFTAPPADAQPVAWLAIYHGEVYDEAISITRSVVEAQADRFGWESALTEIIPLYRHDPPAPTVASGENCWSCRKFFTYAQHSESDGYCPHCNAPVDLDEGEPEDEA